MNSNLTTLVICALISVSVLAAKVDSNVHQMLTWDDAPAPVVVHLKEQFDLSKLPSHFKSQAERGKAVAAALEAHTMEALYKAYPFLKTRAGVEKMTPIWISNSVRIKATQEILSKLIAASGNWNTHVEAVTRDKRFKIEELSDTANATLASPYSPIWSSKVGWGVEKVRAPELWKQGVTGKGVLVAMIDSGVAIKHPDLAPAIWVNPGETGNEDAKENNGTDDDNNGYTDDVNGWNFDTQSNDVSDRQGHGSQTAGLVGGVGTGGTQTGVAPGVKMMVLRACCDLASTAGETAIMEAMQYAVKNGANIISMSLSIKHYSNPSYAKWRRASEVVLAAGVVHINSAGNRGSGQEPHNIGAPASNPPAWYHPEQTEGKKLTSMITIGATDEEDKLRSYSSVGPVTWEDIPEYKDFPYEAGKKPGLLKPEVCGPSEVPSTSMDGKTYTAGFGGTSSATPQVAGVAALLLSARKDLTVGQVTEALQMSAVKIESDYNKCGSGRVDAVAALEYANRKFK